MLVALVEGAAVCRLVLEVPAVRRKRAKDEAARRDTCSVAVVEVATQAAEEAKLSFAVLLHTEQLPIDDTSTGALVGLGAVRSYLIGHTRGEDVIRVE